MARDGLDFNVEGMPEMLGKLEALDYDMKRKSGRFALRKAAQLLRDQAKANAKRVDDPATAADIAANIVERWSNRTFRRTGNLMFRVGVMGGAGGSRTGSELADLPGGDTRHWRHVEFGTEDTPAKPIFRPVPAQAGQQAVDEFVKQYSRKIDRVLRQAKKKAGVK